jgi:3-deoxy-D-manno-octulosonic-acid transferase
MTLESIIPANKITNSGDTRFDRVTAIAQKFEPVPGIEDFCADHQVIVAGSTWEDDEAEWIHYVKTHSEIRFIIAPHEIDKENLADVKKHFPTSVFYSQWIAREQRLMINDKRIKFNLYLSLIANIKMILAYIKIIHFYFCQ